MPARRIVANLAPADLRKAGPQYDLAIALATNENDLLSPTLGSPCQ